MWTDVLLALKGDQANLSCRFKGDVKLLSDHHQSEHLWQGFAFAITIYKSQEHCPRGPSQLVLADNIIFHCTLIMYNKFQSLTGNSRCVCVLLGNPSFILLSDSKNTVSFEVLSNVCVWRPVFLFFPPLCTCLDTLASLETTCSVTACSISPLSVWLPVLCASQVDLWGVWTVDGPSTDSDDCRWLVPRDNRNTIHFIIISVKPFSSSQPAQGIPTCLPPAPPANIFACFWKHIPNSFQQALHRGVPPPAAH